MKIINRKIKAILFFLAYSGIMHATDTLEVQKKIAVQSIYMNAKVNGNGFGLQYIPTLAIRFGSRIIISGGPVFSAVEWKRTGMTADAGYLLIRENKSYSGHTSFSMNCSVTRINNADLSPVSIAYEKRMASGTKDAETPSFENIHYAGWEYAAGFNMNYRFRCGLMLRTGVAYAYTETHQKNFPVIYTTRADNFGSLQLSAGIGWGFGKMISKTEHEKEMISEEEQEENSADSVTAQQ